MEHNSFIRVALPLAIRRELTYAVPQDLRERIVPGLRVVVPLGRQKIIGCVLGFSEKPSFQTKAILDIAEEAPSVTPLLLRLLQWSAAYYLTPTGEVLRHLLPASYWELRKTSKKKRAKKLPSWEGFASSNIQPLLLTEDQKCALEKIRNIRGPVLLKGVTGSGKTEVYIELVRSILKEGGQALVMVPEIGLTPQLIGRFRSRLSDTIDEDRIVIAHSALTPGQRAQVWREASESKPLVVIATRSGIFLPLPLLKAIIIDEEHDASYKQDERFCYHGRDLALWRAAEEKITVVMGSATPSLEVRYRVDQGKMECVLLNERAAGALPEIQIIDRRSDPQEGLSKALLEALAENLKRREQSLLFLNRRGFSPFVLCPQCGFIPKCHSCDISLTLHGPKNPKLLCHYCSYEVDFKLPCPKCHQGTMGPTGFGTQRIESHLKSFFPSARIQRLDRDTAEGEGWYRILEKMKKGEIDILIGTQMVTKGHDYPNLTLVGILDADLSLWIPDFRAAERTYQLLTQVAGRSGRSEKKGRVLVQTYHPHHPSLLAAIHRKEDEFYEREKRERQEAGYPPFQRLVEIRVTGREKARVRESIRVLSKKIKSIGGDALSVTGPAPCSLERVRDRVRWRLLLKTPSYAKIQPILSRVLDDFIENDLPSQMKATVNVDPVDLF